MNSSMSFTRCILTVYLIFLISSAINCGEKGEGKAYQERITASEVKVEELKAFARAFIKVQSALKEPAEESGERTYERTTSIVKHEGLTVGRYTQLAQLMSKDADFKGTIEEMTQKISLEE